MSSSQDSRNTGGCGWCVPVSRRLRTVVRASRTSLAARRSMSSRAMTSLRSMSSISRENTCSRSSVDSGRGVVRMISCCLRVARAPSFAVPKTHATTAAPDRAVVSALAPGEANHVQIGTSTPTSKPWPIVTTTTPRSQMAIREARIHPNAAPAALG
jgi:hypothetical protein